MSFLHVHQPAPGGRLFVALHGTGGDERDLLPLAGALDPDAGFISPRGKVSEYGANRFFRRHAEGVFDLEDLALQTKELGEFLQPFCRVEEGPSEVLALGYSNGANMAASLLLTRPDLLDGAILLRAMVPFESETVPGLAGKRVLLLSGEHDPILPVENAKRLAEILRSGGADVVHRILPVGHGLTQADVEIAREWLK